MFSRLLATPLRKASAAVAATTTVGLGYVASQTTLIHPLPANDPIFSTPSYRKFNPHSNPVNDDRVTKEIPLDSIRPELLESDETLTLALCQATWSQAGFSPLRTFWRLRHFGPATTHQLWTASECSKATYEPGTELTNSFTVLTNTTNSPTSSLLPNSNPSPEITVRFGDVPANSGLRPLDGLFAIEAKMDKERGVAKLTYTTLAWKGDEKVPEGTGRAVPLPADAVHWWVARVWMTLASGKLQK